MQLVVCSIEVVSLTCAAFSANMIPQFALSMGVTSIDSCQWALVRSVFTKMVDKDEVGKVFSFVAILAATLTLFAFPAFKKLYNATLTVFPSAFLLAAAALYLIALALNIVLFTVRSRFSPGKDDDDDDDKEPKDENVEEEKKEKKDENGNLDTAERKAE